MTDKALQGMHAQACTRIHQHMRSNSFVWLWGQAVPQQMAKNEYLHQLKIPWCCWTFQAGPALISQLAILEPPISFHPGHSVPDRGHLEFKAYSPNSAATSQLVWIKPSWSKFQTREVLERHFRIQMVTFESTLFWIKVCYFLPCILSWSVSQLLS